MAIRCEEVESKSLSSCIFIFLFLRLRLPVFLKMMGPWIVKLVMGKTNLLKFLLFNLQSQGKNQCEYGLPHSLKFDNLRGAGAAHHKLLEVSSSSDSEEEGQAFYVGGSERSGQQVIGPPRQKGKPSGDLIGDMFKSARECVFIILLLKNNYYISTSLNLRHGAEVLEKGASTSTKGSYTFKGTGYRLGQNEGDTQGFSSILEHNLLLF